MKVWILAYITAVAAIMACSDDRGREVAVTDSLSRSIEAGRAVIPDSGLEPIAGTSDSGDNISLPETRDQPAARPASKAQPPSKARSAPKATPARRRVRARPAAPPTQVPAREPAASAPATPADADPAPALPAGDPAPSPSSTDTVPRPAAAPPAAAPPAAASVPSAGGSVDEAARTLPAGTRVSAALSNLINSRRDTAGKRISAQVMDNVSDARGRLVLPAGSLVHMTVTALAPARSRSANDGKLAFRVDSIDINGVSREVSAEVQGVPHELRGRGVTAGEAEKVGVGAAAGAVAGRVLGGNTKGAVIGGVVGAAGGAVVAHHTASRDVIVKPRTPVVFVLTAPFTVPPR